MWSKTCQKRQRSARQPPVDPALVLGLDELAPGVLGEEALEARHRPAGQAGAGEQDRVVGRPSAGRGLRLGLGERVQRRLDQAEAAPAAGDALRDEADPRRVRDRRRQRGEGGRAARGRRSGSAPGRPRRPRPACAPARRRPRGGRGRGSGTGASSGAQAAVGHGHRNSGSLGRGRQRPTRCAGRWQRGVARPRRLAAPLRSARQLRPELGRTNAVCGASRSASRCTMRSGTASFLVLCTSSSSRG